MHRHQGAGAQPADQQHVTRPIIRHPGPFLAPPGVQGALACLAPSCLGLPGFRAAWRRQVVYGHQRAQFVRDRLETLLPVDHRILERGHRLFDPLGFVRGTRPASAYGPRLPGSNPLEQRRGQITFRERRDDGDDNLAGIFRPLAEFDGRSDGRP